MYEGSRRTSPPRDMSSIPSGQLLTFLRPLQWAEVCLFLFSCMSVFVCVSNLDMFYVLNGYSAFLTNTTVISDIVSLYKL